MPDEYTGPFAKSDPNQFGISMFDRARPTAEEVIDARNDAETKGPYLRQKLKDMDDAFAANVMQAFILGGEAGAKAFADRANAEIAHVILHLAEHEATLPVYGPPHPDDDPSAPPNWNADSSDDSAGN